MCMTLMKFDPIIKPERLPGGDVIDLDLIDGFNDLDPDQKQFIGKYLQMFPRKLAAAQAVGVSINKVKQWNNDEEFKSILETVKQIYAESLASVHLEESFTNSKIRGQVLKALDAEGYENKSQPKTQNNLIVSSDQGLAGLINGAKK